MESQTPPMDPKVKQRLLEICLTASSMVVTEISIPDNLDGATTMRRGPKLVCNCGECRICKQRYYRWNHNLKKHITKPAPYVKNLHERGCYHTATTLEMVANGELLPIGEACKVLDREFPWLQGVELKGDRLTNVNSMGRANT